MARGDSTILVRILGDAKGLVSALGSADRSLGRTAKNLVVGGAALIGVHEAFQFLQDSTEEADRLGDATARLEIQLGDLAGPLVDTASSFRDLGLSSQDVLELEANFADLATTVGLGDDAIAAFADDAAATAEAVSLLENVDAATVIEQIGRAANGSEKAMLALGVSVDEAEVVARALATTGKDTAGALTDGELAAARLAIILDQLKPKLDAATTGTADLELNQRRLDAAAEELQAKLGGPLSDGLATVLGFINDEVDAIPGAIAGWQMLGKAVTDVAGEILTPIARAADAVRGLLDLLGQLDAGANTGQSGGLRSRNPGGSSFERDVTQAVNNNASRNNLERAQGK